ncbi:hypothetical protein KJ644_05055, partial [Candidatus Dependentiae bacterium]|nr:hypothetical protein [Candidatus Dependentiae bacterium]
MIKYQPNTAEILAREARMEKAKNKKEDTMAFNNSRHIGAVESCLAKGETPSIGFTQEVVAQDLLRRVFEAHSGNYEIVAAIGANPFCPADLLEALAKVLMPKINRKNNPCVEAYGT